MAGTQCQCHAGSDGLPSLVVYDTHVHSDFDIETRKQIREELRCMICLEVLKEAKAVAEVGQGPSFRP